MNQAGPLGGALAPPSPVSLPGPVAACLLVMPSFRHFPKILLASGTPGPLITPAPEPEQASHLTGPGRGQAAPSTARVQEGQGRPPTGRGLSVRLRGLEFSAQLRQCWPAGCSWAARGPAHYSRLTDRPGPVLCAGSPFPACPPHSLTMGSASPDQGHCCLMWEA